MICFLHVANAQVVQLLLFSVLTPCVTVRLPRRFGTNMEGTHSFQTSVSACNSMRCHELKITIS